MCIEVVLNIGVTVAIRVTTDDSERRRRYPFTRITIITNYITDDLLFSAAD